MSLFSEINKNKIGKNVIISPLSIFQALSLLSNGAIDETQEEICETLNFESLEKLNQKNFDILDKSKDFTSIEIANAVMSRFELLPDFIEIAEKYFSSVEELESLSQVNGWCKEKTHGKIPKILDSLGKDTLMILLNAIYFKAEWFYPFDKNSNLLKPFYNFNSEDSMKEIETMTLTKYISYYYEKNFLEMVELPFWQDGVSAYVILPYEKIDINDFISEKFTNEKFYNYVSKMDYKNVELEMPKFEVSFDIKLRDELMEMGIVEAFVNDKGFLNLREEGGLKIDDVIHKTYLKVDENGCEAAAVTAIVFNGTDFFPFEDETVKMKVNRPFLFVLRSSFLPENNDILFISKIENIE